MTKTQWQQGSGSTLALANSGIEISEHIAYESRDRLFRLWVDGHNHGLFWELEMAKDVAARIHASNRARAANEGLNKLRGMLKSQKAE